METLASRNRQSWLSWFLRGILILGLGILVSRLFELQVIKGDYFRKLSEGNRIRRIPISAPRGKILARGGEIIVGNVEVKKRIVFDPLSGYSKTNDLEGAGEDETVTDWIREYKLADKAAHLTGYLGEVGEGEVGKIDPQCPQNGPARIGDLTGRGGLEQWYNCILSGVDGEELVEVDTFGKRVRTLGRKEPIAGTDVKTTIDINLQQKVHDLMQGASGAVVISDAAGEILAIYSSPSFDPNAFIQKDSAKINSYLKDTNLPFFNRAVAGIYHPGSVFKPIVSIAALEEGKISKDFIYEDTGLIEVNDFSYTNWYFTQYGGVEGKIDLVRAMARSTDTFFYKIGEYVGIDKIAQWSEKFGLGQKTKIDLPGETAGLVPTPQWKMRVKKESWFLGNTYHVAIGQGDLSLTPIELNTAIAAIASRGEFCYPKIAESPECKKLNIKDEHLELVIDGMIAACTSGGTGYTFFDFDPQVACKTGTAETNVEGETHAWFTVFAPHDFPEIMATVLVEKGGEGSRVAGPIAREILDFWKEQN